MKKINEIVGLGMLLHKPAQVIVNRLLDKKKFDDNEEHRQEIKAKDDAAWKEKYGNVEKLPDGSEIVHGPKSEVSPAIPAPKPSGRQMPQILPKYINYSEDPKSGKVEVPSELRKTPSKTSKQDTTAPTKDSLSFGQAFAKNRKAGATEFTWQGKKYTTKLKESIQEDSNPSIIKKKKNEGLPEFLQDKDKDDYQLPDLGGKESKSELDRIRDHLKSTIKGIKDKASADVDIPGIGKAKISPTHKGEIHIQSKEDDKKKKRGKLEIIFDPKNEKGSVNYTMDLEDVNVVSGGQVAGLGVGSDGEPGIPKKRKSRIVDLISFMKRK